MVEIQRYFRAFPLLSALVVLLLTPLADAQNIQPLTDRVDAIVAHPLVLPVTIKDPKAIKSGLRVRLDDGRDVPASASFVWASSTDPGTGWTRTTPVWNLVSPSQYLKSPPAFPGTWIAMIDLPIDAVGQGIWIDELRYEPNWLPSPARVILETSSRAHDGFWDAALTDSDLRSPLISDAISNLRADPFNRWRAQLLSEGFRPDANTGTNPAHSDRDLIAIHTELLQSDSAEIMDLIADHFASRWQIILGRIWLIDPQVAHRLKHQLSRTVRAGNTVVPLWTDDTNQLTALAHDLLSPFVDDELRVERVLAWLDSQPSSMSWIIDDAGQPTRTPTTLSPTIGMLLMKHDDSSDPSELTRIQSAGADPQVFMLQSGVMRDSTFNAPSSTTPNGSQIDQPRKISVQIGAQRSNLKGMGDIPVASPPGVLIGPLLNDWNLSAFASRQSAQGALPEPAYRVAGLLHRTSQISESDPRVGWRIYLECAIDPKAEHDTSVRVWIGAMGFTRVSWTISRSLGLVEVRSDPDIIVDPAFTSTIEKDRWIIELDIPPAAVSDDGFITLGLERTDPNHHSSWPRRMMPWQSEPGRFVIDTTGWNGTETSP